jgi:8-oxo-dGTP pyrophosphatase MutT (NUDIX family)
MTVRAAGGVLVRDGAEGAEVLVVHRPRHDDWSLPKGKADPGEDPATTALREVEEETGWIAEITGDLGEGHYTDHRGRPKTVTWFRMRPVRTSERPTDDEVDEMRWLAPADARGLLTYDTDRALLEDLV